MMENITISEVTEELDPQLQHIKGAVESLLFVNEKPVTLDQIKNVLETVGAVDIKNAIADLQKGYEARHSGIMIIEIAGGYQMLSNPAYASYLRNFYKTKHKEKLSKPALESMAIIAYKQPVTRTDVELIRGVNSDGVVAHLLDKELIKVVGRKDVPGRPYMYGTTRQFLEYFGLKSLDDLPALEEFPALQPTLLSRVEGQGQEMLPQDAGSTSEEVSGRDVQKDEASFTDGAEGNQTDEISDVFQKSVEETGGETEEQV
jgi:segregation and condensation protein B